jgi:hypothetical protein
MDYQKVRAIEDRISKNRHKLMSQTDSKKKEILRIRISIDELKAKLERIK